MTHLLISFPDFPTQRLERPIIALGQRLRVERLRRLHWLRNGLLRRLLRYLRTRMHHLRNLAVKRLVLRHERLYGRILLVNDTLVGIYAQRLRNGLHRLLCGLCRFFLQRLFHDLFFHVKILSDKDLPPQERERGQAKE